MATAKNTKNSKGTTKAASSSETSTTNEKTRPKRRAGVDYDKVPDEILFGTYVAEARENPAATYESVAERLKDQVGLVMPPDIISNRCRGVRTQYDRWARGYTVYEGKGDDRKAVSEVPPKHGPMRGLPLPPLGGVARGSKPRDHEALAAQLGLEVD